MPTLPSRYPFAEKVPEGGASCANCYFLNDDGKCRNRFYKHEVDADGKLGAAADSFCCMAWSQESRKEPRAMMVAVPQPQEGKRSA